MDYKEFSKKCFEGRDNEEMFPNGTDAQEGLKILVKHFLGYIPIMNYPGSTAQWNSEAIYEILKRYPEGKIRKIPKLK